MGTRAQVRFEFTPDSFVNFYQHWDGDTLEEAVRVALDSPPARERWHDPEYCTRVCIHQLLIAQEADPNSPTGFGIGPRDAEGITTVIRFHDGTVIPDGVEPLSFADFCKGDN